MRSFLIVLLCLAALAGGVAIAVVASGHLPEIAQFWNAGNAVYGTVKAQAATDDPGVDAWKPPDILPAHPNWTWHMPDGKTYENVVITEVKPGEVTITHSLGVAHLSLDAVPADVQRELRYVPSAKAPAVDR